MAAARSAAIYARISSDQDGSGLGVARQVQDCERLAESLGWSVVECYVDNDVSAYSGKRRPEYRRMLADIADGLRDAVIVYHVDRLTRRPIELEQFVAAVGAVKGFQLKCVAGETDINSGDGLMVARIMASVAANESAAKSRRIRRKHEQLAEQGLPNGGSLRPFGFERDRLTVREHEAVVLRTLVERYLAGESLRSLTTWLGENKITTVSGGAWTTTTLRGVLVNPRYAGLRAHRGQVVGRAVWDPIISDDLHRRVVARFAERAVSGRRPPRRYLLSGLLRCGRCGGVLFSSRRENSRRYVCLSGPDHRGCGRLTVVADSLERLIADAVVVRLDTKEMADALAGRAAADAHTAALAEQISQDRTQLDELAKAFAAKHFTMREWMTARSEIDERVREQERRLARATRTDALTGLVGNGDALRSQWATLNLSRQHAIVRAVLDHATILPGTSGARSLDVERVAPQWRHL